MDVDKIRINLIIGKNNSEKTSLLDVLSCNFTIKPHKNINDKELLNRTKSQISIKY